MRARRKITQDDIDKAEKSGGFKTARDFSPTWKIVAIKEEGIALSGPGPCRTYKVVDHDTFDAEWDVVWCASPSGHENEECHMVYAGNSPRGVGMTCAFCGRDRNWNVVGETYFQRMTRPPRKSKSSSDDKPE
jgi:hypothetical protein